MHVEEYKPKILNEYINTCPSCLNKSLHVVEALHRIPYTGKILIVSVKCKKCGFRHTDVFNVEQGKPIRISYKVDNVADLSVKVVRSGTATIKIPELNLMIEPGPLSQGEITTIEGYILRFMDMLDLICGDNKKAHEELKRKLKLALEGRINFTFIIEDPFGNSSIITPHTEKLKVMRMSPDEVRKLKYGDLIVESNRGRNHVEKETT
ncbi:MAG: ZPR1 zinc finger domain-containing protein [Thermoprotei archaeon]|nr:ZPR1 zinc finger domain-containing protein [Thermoprotei archaeon]